MAPKPDKPTDTPILLSSYTFRDHPFAVACQKAVQYGYDGIASFAQMGIKLINASVAPLRNPENERRSGSWLAEDWHYERASAGVRALLPALQEHASLLTLEMTQHTLHDCAQSTRELLRAVASPLVKANLDAGNLFAIPGAEHPAHAVEILDDHIGYLHLKNARQVGDHFDFSHLLEEGNLDYFAILTAVRQHGLAVPMLSLIHI